MLILGNSIVKDAHKIRRTKSYFKELGNYKNEKPIHPVYWQTPEVFTLQNERYFLYNRIKKSKMRDAFRRTLSSRVFFAGMVSISNFVKLNNYQRAFRKKTFSFNIFYGNMKNRFYNFVRHVR